MTIHKLLGLRPTIDRKTGDLFFHSKGESAHFRQIERKLVIVDESSMVGKKMYEEIDKYTHLYPVKTMLCGDPMQLPPVGEKRSIVFRVLDYDQEDQAIPASICLDQIMRTSSPVIMAVSMAIRTWDRETVTCSQLVDHLVDIYQTQTGKKSFRLYHANPRVTSSTWFKNMILHIENGRLPTITTWRNAIADRYNDQVRKHIHKGKDLSNYLVGDFMMFNKHHRTAEGQVFNTSSVARITDVTPTSKPLCNWETYMLPEVTSRQENEYNRVLRRCQKLGEFEVNKLTVERPKEGGTATVYTMAPNEVKRFEEAVLEIRNLMENYYRQCKHDQLSTRLWTIFQEKVLGGYAHICFGYSLTTHKAQGSTFECAIVDLVDIMSNPNKREAHHALYTAVGRASRELAIIVD